MCRAARAGAVLGTPVSELGRINALGNCRGVRESRGALVPQVLLYCRLM